VKKRQWIAGIIARNRQGNAGIKIAVQRGLVGADWPTQLTRSLRVALRLDHCSFHISFSSSFCKQKPNPRTERLDEGMQSAGAPVM
jgi:hypothetical protein